MAKTTARRTRSRARPTRITGKRLDAAKAATRHIPLARPMASVQPGHDTIAKKAYEIWLTNGCPVDNDLGHWLEAEHLLNA